MFCDQETLPSCSVHMGFGLNCPLAEYTMLKDVLNKKGLPKKKKNDCQSTTFTRKHEDGRGAGHLSSAIGEHARDALGYLGIQCPGQ